MALIDRYIEQLFDEGARRLAVASGEPVTLHRGETSRVLSRGAPTIDQVATLLAEILPPGQGALEQPGHHTFQYQAPAGQVEVRALRTDETIRLLVVPGERNNGGPESEQRHNGGPASEQRHDDSVASGRQHNGSPPSGQRHNGRTAPAEPDSRQETDPDAPVMVRLFRSMVAQGCSDLHISAANPPLFRKDGEMTALGDREAFTPERTREILFEIAPERNRKEFEEAHDTDFAYEIEGLARFRCNLFMDRKGMGGVFRQIPAEIMTSADLGLPQSILDLCRLSKGLVVVTGPTGSGKSTTLAALIDHINETRRDHIITIEDPIEFVHQNKQCLINQREVGVHTAGFKSALRAALREDPDIVLVGEMRDLETVQIALETAETGHLVFGTLHTNTAPSTVDRIIDQFPADQQNQIRTMLSESLKGVVAQTLCRRKEGGRVAALEILIVNNAVSNLVREGKTFQIPSIMQTSRGAGMTTLNDALLGLVREGVVEPAEAYRKAVARSEFRTLLTRNGYEVAEEPAG